MQQVGVRAVFDVNAFVSGANVYIRTLNMVNNETSNTMSQIGSHTQRAGGHFDFLGRAMSQAFGNAISYIQFVALPRLVGAFEDAVRNMINTGANFQQEIAIMGSVVDDASIPVEMLGDIAIKVGNDTSVLGASARGAAEAMTLLYKGGLSTNEILGDMQGYLASTVPLGGALRAVFDLAAAGTLDMATAADIAVIALSTFGREMETEEDRANFVNVALDNMVRAANASVAEVSGLAEAWRYVGPAAANARIGVADINTALAIMSNYGLQASSAGTSLNGMLTDLTETTAKSREEMAQLGINIFNSKGELLPLVDIVGQFEVALRGATDQERIEALGKIFDVRGARAMNALLDAGVDGWNEMGEAINGATSMHDQAIIRLDTLRGRQEILNSLFETFAISIEKEFDEALKNLLDTIVRLAQNIGPDMIDFFSRLGDALNAVILLLGKDPETMSALSNVFRGIKENDPGAVVLNLTSLLQTLFGEDYDTSWLADYVGLIGDLASAGPQLAEGFAAITGGDIVGGITQIGEALQAAFGDDVGFNISDTVNGIVDAISQLTSGDIVGGIGTFRDTLVSAFGEDVGKTFDKVVTVIGLIAGAIATLATVIAGSAVVSLIGSVVTAISGVAGVAAFVAGALSGLGVPIAVAVAAIAALVAVIVANWDSIAPVFEAIKVAVAAVIERVISTISVFKPQWDTLLASLGELWQALQPVLQILGGALVIAFGVVISVIGAVVSALVVLIDGFVRVATGIVDALTGVVQFVTGFVQIIIGLFQGLITGNWDILITGFNNIKDGVVNIVTGLATAIYAVFTGALMTVATFIGQFVENVIAFFTNLWHTLVGGSIIPDMVNQIVTWFTTLVSKGIALVSKFVADVIQWFVDLLNKVVSAVTDLVTKVSSKLSDLVKKGVEFITEFVNKIVEKAKELPKEMANTIQNAINKVREFVGRFRDIGGDLIGGLVDGVKAAAGRLLDAARNVVQGAVDGVRGLLRSHSPSKLFMEIGYTIPEGMGIGISRGAVNPMRALGGMVNNMANMVSPALAQSTTNNYNYTTLEINPTYANTQSEASVYYDAVAALAAVRN